MARAKGKVVAKVKRKPTKAGSNASHGGFPTQKVIMIRAKMLSDAKKKNYG